MKLRIKELRTALGWTQAELADRACVRRATINRLENHPAITIDLDVLDRIASALGVEPGFVLVRGAASKGGNGRRPGGRPEFDGLEHRLNRKVGTAEFAAAADASYDGFAVAPPAFGDQVREWLKGSDAVPVKLVRACRRAATTYDGRFQDKEHRDLLRAYATRQKA